MILSKTPIRISLFGGATNFPEYFNKNRASIIGGTINKFIYTSLIKQKLKIKNNKIKLFYRIKEEANDVTKIKHAVIKEALIKYKVKENIEMHISSDLPSHTGLGSSSAFTVGLLNLLQRLKKNKKNFILMNVRSNFSIILMDLFRLTTVIVFLPIIIFFENKYLNLFKYLIEKNLRNFKRLASINLKNKSIFRSSGIDIH